MKTQTYFKIFGFVILLSLVSTSFIVPKRLLGTWKIETVLVESDTLFHKSEIKFTAQFFNSQMGTWQKTDSDKEFFTRCIHSTYVQFSQSKLKINQKNYTLTEVLPCEDRIKIKAIQKGKYKLEMDTLNLQDSNLKLNFVENRLIYVNLDYRYRIVFMKNP